MSLAAINRCKKTGADDKDRVATAYAITKALLPLRLGLSLWLTPSFAKISTLPVKRLFTRKAVAAAPASKVAASPAAGTNSVGGKTIK